VPAEPDFGRFAYAQDGAALTSSIGMTFAVAASSSVASSPAHEYPGDAGSRASNPLGLRDGAIARHETPIRTYVAPAERESENATWPCVLLNSSGSKRAVTSGAVPAVECDATRPAMPADAVTAARQRIPIPVDR